MSLTLTELTYRNKFCETVQAFDIRHTYSFTNKEGDRIIPLQDKGFKKH